jgi:hypothetical protein
MIISPQSPSIPNITNVFQGDEDKSEVVPLAHQYKIILIAEDYEEEEKKGADE